MLSPLLAQVATRLALHGSGFVRQRLAATQAQRVIGNTARSRQLHTGSKARSSRYGLEGIGPKNH